VPAYQRCPDYYLGTSTIVDFVRCIRCNMLQQAPVPKDTSALYADYPIHQSKSRLFRAFRWLVMSKMYFAFPADAHLSVLDYGCGDGGYLDEMKQRSQARLLGYEPVPAQASRLAAALRMPVYSSIDDLIADEAGKLDVVTMHMVLEHVVDPDAAIARAAHLLKHGGTLHIVVPNAESFEARLFGRNWHNLDAPRHISFPAESHMRSMAARHGLTLSRSGYVPFPNGVAGSLPVVISGRFRFALFALFLPLGIVWSRLAPSGVHAFTLTKL